jgi:hypothetical protein
VSEPVFPDGYPESHKGPLSEWWQHKKEIGKVYKPTGWKNLLSEQIKVPSDQLAANVAFSISNNWQGIYEAKQLRPSGSGYSNGKRPANADDIPPASSEPGYVEPILTQDDLRPF